jgi:hypothetical protein
MDNIPEARVWVRIHAQVRLAPAVEWAEHVPRQQLSWRRDHESTTKPPSQRRQGPVPSLPELRAQT